MLDRWLRLGLTLAAGAACFGCSDTPEAPPPPNEDRALECVPDGAEPEGGTAGMDGGASLSCASGEVCVQGRCYDACTPAGDDCGPREMCAGGICVRRVGPEPDAGTNVDSGPVLPCDGVTCTDPEVCHPRSGQCGACSEDTVEAPDGTPGACGGLQPICDIANGRCIERAPAQCAPCNLDGECDPGDMSFIGMCVVRDIMGWREQVCLRVCDAMMNPCPAGLACNGGFCEPPSGASCTTWRAAVDRATCAADGDCNIANTSGAPIFFVDACEGEMPGDPDGGMPMPGVCVQPCGNDAECFDMAGGQMCVDTGNGLRFCVVP